MFGSQPVMRTDVSIKDVFTWRINIFISEDVYRSGPMVISTDSGPVLT